MPPSLMALHILMATMSTVSIAAGDTVPNNTVNSPDAQFRERIHENRRRVPLH